MRGRLAGGSSTEERRASGSPSEAEAGKASDCVRVRRMRSVAGCCGVTTIYKHGKT